jgi:hypothetical protein
MAIRITPMKMTSIKVEVNAEAPSNPIIIRSNLADGDVKIARQGLDDDGGLSGWHTTAG